MINFIPETNDIIGYIFIQIQGLFQIFSLTQKPYSINGLKFSGSGFFNNSSLHDAGASHRKHENDTP